MKVLLRFRMRPTATFIIKPGTLRRCPKFLIKFRVLSIAAAGTVQFSWRKPAPRETKRAKERAPPKAHDFRWEPELF